MPSRTQLEIAQQKKLLVDALLQAERAEQPEVYPASLAQQRLWFLDQLQGPTSAYNVHVGLWLYGPLNVAALQSSLQEVVRRHDTLRTTFTLEKGDLLQVVARTSTVALPTTDFSHLSEPYPAAYELAKQEVGKPFDLRTGPLFRTHLLRIAAEENVLLCVMHHTITDAWSMQVFAKELGLLYDAFSNGRTPALPEIPIQYGDYSEWQHASFRTEDVQKQLAYWKEALQHAPPVLELPQDRPRPAEQTLQGATHTFTVPGDLAASIRSVATKLQATPFMLLLTAFKVLLYRYSGQTDLLVGVPVAGRNLVETEGLIGFFVSTLALRNDLRGNPRFVDLLAQVRETTLAAFAHADVPFEKVVEVLQPERNLSYNPIFQVMFSAIKSPLGSSDFGNLKVYPYIVEASSSIFDLSMTLVEWMDGKLFTQVDYNTDLFDYSTIERLQQHFRNLLSGITADPEQRISDLPLLSVAEEQQLVVDFNNTGADFRRDLCLHQFFEQQVARTPDAVAVVCGEERISYDQLNQRAGKLAAYLLSQSVGPNVLVGLCADRSINLLVGILGILKAGGAYVPLDPAYPEDRLRCIVEDSRLKLLLTEGNLNQKFSGSGLKFIDLAGDWPAIDSPQMPQVSATTPNDLAYVLFTSGSTGRPKGVALEHRNAANFVQWAQSVFTPEELAGTLFATSVCFDLSVFEIFVPWSAGGAVILAPNAISLDELPAATEVTLINTVPSVMAELVRAGAVPDSVLTVNLAGEALPGALVNALYERTKVRNVYNLYGPTEATTYATYTPVSRAVDVTIGKPIANTQAYILDRDRKLVPQGGLGELYLGGEGLAQGYFGRPDLTAERFVANPFSAEVGARLYRTGDLCRHRADGTLEYLGRLDHQVKLRGFRIELGEIEAVLEKHPAVRQAVAAVRESSGEKRLAAYVIAKPGRTISVSELRKHLEKSLPPYMLPDAFMVVDEFPRTLNGKVDRNALPSPEAPASTKALAPRNELETTLVRIWENVLDVRPVGVTDNFFDLGGHSLLAARLIAQMHTVIGEKIPLSAIFRAPTIETLARLLTSDSISKPDPVLMQLHQGEGVPFFAIAAPGVDSIGFALLARHLGEEQSVFKLQSQGPLIWERPFEKEELLALAREYVSAMRAVQPHGPYCLGGMCDGVLIAQQMILELESQGEEVALFAIFDTWVLENSQIRPLWAIDYYLQRVRAFPDLPLKEQLAIVRRTLKRWAGRNGSGRSAWPQAYWPGENFQMPSFRAPVLLFKRPRQPYYYVRDPEMGWGARSSGGVEVCEVDCGHQEMLRLPHVRVLGERLAAHLQAVTERVMNAGLQFVVVPTENSIESGFTQPAQ